LKENLNKTDRNDARGIAQLVRTGTYRIVHLKAPETRRVQALLTVRRLVLSKALDIENGIGGILRSFGLKVPGRKLKDYDLKIRSDLRSNSELRRIVEPLLELRTVLLAQFERVDAEVKALAQEDPICRRLMTAPGVGPIVAVTYRAVIDVPERFSRSRTVGAHLGLTPRTVQSGVTEYRTRISKRGDTELRRALYLAGLGVLRTRGSPSPLRDWGEQIAARRGRGRALIAIARRLAVILHRMWLDGTDYQHRPTPA
jgi:transposase